MSRSHHSDRLRNECQVCGSSMRYEGKAAPARNGHHASLFYCPKCDEYRRRG